MSTGYSAHPALVSEQLQNAERANSIPTKSLQNNSKSIIKHQDRRHNSANASAEFSGRHAETTSWGFFAFPPFNFTKSALRSNETTPKATEDMSTSLEAATAPTRTTTPQKTLPDRTSGRFKGGVDDVSYDGEAEDNTNDHTKDCVDCTTTNSQSNPNIDEPDHMQPRFSRSRSQTHDLPFVYDEHADAFSSRKIERDGEAKHHQILQQTISDGCVSELSSAISSPSPSTVSSPLSTPTRLTTQLHHSHQHCCRKSSSLSPASTLGALSMSTSNHYRQHHQHQHHHHHHHHHPHTTASGFAGGCKKLQKFDPRTGPSPYRQLLPITLCILSFATVFTILIIYMDTTEIRHQQFRLNMSRDYDLYGVAQDDPTLIAFLREIHLRKYPMHFLKNRGETAANSVSASGAYNFSSHHDGLAPEMAHYAAELVGGKLNGAVIQSLTGALGQLMTAPWLSETLNWAGIVIEPEPRRFFTLRKQNARHTHLQVVHACVSPNSYPKEVTIHNEEPEVRINSLLDEETSWFNSRVKCFPLYTIMLACNRIEYDLLSLGVHGHELQILQTLPFDKIKIEVISIHLPDNFDKTPHGYIQALTKFLAGKGYKLQKNFGSNYFYQRINTTNRTRKKDIFLKTP